MKNGVSVVEAIVEADIRWYERSIRRLFGDELEARSGQDPEVAVTSSFGIGAKNKNSHSTVIIKMRIDAQLDGADAAMEAAIQFGVGSDLDPDNQGHVADVKSFVDDFGGEYVLGVLRGALADATRSVGLPAVLLPFADLEVDDAIRREETF